jgi:hypothetical protein
MAGAGVSSLRRARPCRKLWRLIQKPLRKWKRTVAAGGSGGGTAWRGKAVRRRRRSIAWGKRSGMGVVSWVGWLDNIATLGHPGIA